MFCVKNVKLKRPRSHLSSSTIFTALETHLVPPLLNECNVVALRGIFSGDREDVTMQIAARRAQIEKKLQNLSQTCFIVSAVTQMARESKKKARLDAASSAPSEADGNSTSESSGAAAGEGRSEEQGDRLYDGLSFWLASQTVSVKLNNLEMEMKKVFLAAGFSIEECSPIRGRSCKKMTTHGCKTLAQVLKDHDLPRAVTLAEESAVKFVNAAIPSSSNADISTWDPEFGKKVVRMIVTANCPISLAGAIRLALREIQAITNLDWDLVDKGPHGEQVVLEKPLAQDAGAGRSKLVEVLDLFKYTLEKSNCRYRKGRVHQFEPRSISSYTSAFSVRDFLGKVCKYPQLSEAITPHLNTISTFLEANPNYCGIEEIEVDYNLVEVLNGWYLDIEGKKFIRNAISKEEIGKRTPRKFFPYPYTPDLVPDPKEYIFSLRNSFKEDDIFKLFIQMLYQLLLTFKFPFKCAKMLCVGPSDSGKTTWIVPIMAVLDEEDVATLTREQVFSAQMLKATTQLLFIDEWTPDKLQFDQCKVLFQGGKQTISKKNKLPDSFGYRSGVYITMNEAPPFPADAHGEAMRRRLQQFKCLTIRPLVRNMDVLYKKQAMEIIHWMILQLEGMDLFENPINRNGKYVRPVEEDQREVLIPDLEQPEVLVEEMEMVDVSVLPRNLIENVMVDVENRVDKDVIPYRLVSPAFDINSLPYHRAVHNCLQGKFFGHINLDVINNHELFTSRRKVGWSKNDSLFDAWLLANFEESRPIFDLDLFTSRYPTWRSDRQPLDVRPPSLIRDDSVYIDDDDICIIKTEECERRNVYVKSTTPFLGPTPLASIVISDSDNSDSGFDVTDYPSIPIRGMALGNIDEDLGLVDNFGVADPAAPSTSTHPTASAQKEYTVETGMALGNIDEDLGLVDKLGVADPAAPSTSAHPTASAQKDYTVETENEISTVSMPGESANQSEDMLELSTSDQNFTGETDAAAVNLTEQKGSTGGGRDDSMVLDSPTSRIVERVKVIDGERMLQSAKQHLQSVKQEEKGSGPPTFWKTLHGPVVVDHEIYIVSSDEE